MSHDITNRREAARLAAHDDHGIVSIRIRPGHAAALVDVSASGALIETAHRLLPGTAVDLHIETRADRASLRARVVRCAVVSVRAAMIGYRGAVAFDRQLPWILTINGEPAVRADARTILPAWAPATRGAV